MDKNLRFLLACTLVLGLATCSLAARALAAPFELTAGLDGLTTNDLTGWVTYTGSPPVGPVNGYIGPLSMTVTDTATGSSIQQTLWCTDIFDDFHVNGLYVISQTDLASRIGATKANQINALLANVAPGDAAQAAAVQAAIWEIENETGVAGYQIDTGLFTASVDADAAEFASDIATYLSNVSGTDGANGIWQPVAGVPVTEYVPIDGPNQSFGFLDLTGGGDSPPVPEPASLGILGLGVFGVAAVRRKRSSRPD